VTKAAHASHRSPTTALLFGLVLTLAMVVAYSWYISRQISGLRHLQTELTDRNRRESLQLLRIQNDLNQLGLAMRDMLDSGEPYPLSAWSTQFDRIRADLNDALAKQEEVAVARRTPEQNLFLSSSVSQFWDAANRIFDLARNGREEEARSQIRLSLQARQASLSTLVARLLVQNNETEAAVAGQVQAIYDRVQRQVYWFLAATLVAIAATSLYLIRANRRVLAELASLADERRGVAHQLIATREATLREISRELHDEFGQLLTAMGSMLGRATRQIPEGSPLRGDLREVSEIAQSALDNMRGRSQSLHPSILEELGLESTIDWYLPTVQKQYGIDVTYQRDGAPAAVDEQTGIHVYRVLQEALANVARHSGAARAFVRLRATSDMLELEVEDHGKGIVPDVSRRGLGLVAMRERAALLGGTLEFLQPAQGGTLVRLRVPIAGRSAA
jgi:signal transduction histidine kinase